MVLNDPFSFALIHPENIEQTVRRECEAKAKKVHTRQYQPFPSSENAAGQLI